MITNEQVEAALKAWYDAGDAGNFASMFAALKAADLETAARIAELEAALKDLLDDWRYMTGIEEADEEDNSAVRAARAALEKKE